LTTDNDIRIVEVPPGVFNATSTVPGDKSLSHRALILTAFAQGTSEINGLGTGHDVAATVRVLRELGITITGNQVVSKGIDAWTEPSGPLQCGNSGTTMRLVAGALAGRPYRAKLMGDRSLSRRPMSRLKGPLEALGATVGLSPIGTPPVEIAELAGKLSGRNVEIDVASAQVRSAFILAALQADGTSSVSSPFGFRDHTERWLESYERGRRLSRTTFEVYPGPLPTNRYDVAGDPSSAAFLWTAAAIRPGSKVTTTGVSLNPGRIGYLQVLESMGADVEAQVTTSIEGDPVGWVSVRGTPLQATEIAGDLTVATLDELPLVAVLAAMAEGVTVVRDAAELRVKESDRIASTVGMIRALGGGAEASNDGFEIIGTGWLESGVVDSVGDHRIAMASAVAAFGTLGPVHIHGAGVAAISWPSFYDDLETLWSSR